MRKFFCFLLVLGFLNQGVTAKSDDSFIIRRAYIDVIGVVPTIEEIEWYCVYNTNGYEKAIDYLVNHKNYIWEAPKETSKSLLLSDKYRTTPKSKIEKTQVYKNLCFTTGVGFEISPEKVSAARLKLVQSAMVCGDGETEIIDFMCLTLMSRTSNLEENSKLSKIIKNSKKNEEDTWLDVLDEILEFEDVNSK